LYSFSATLSPNFNLLNIYDFSKASNLLLVYDILNAKSPVDITDTYSLNGYNDSHYTRGKTL